MLASNRIDCPPSHRFCHPFFSALPDTGRALRAARVEAHERPRPTRTPPALHRGTAARTSRAATAAKSALIRLSSMIALVAVMHFAAEHPVRQRRVGKNDWQDDHHTDEHENLARARCRGSPDA